MWRCASYKLATTMKETYMWIYSKDKIAVSLSSELKKKTNLIFYHDVLRVHTVCKYLLKVYMTFMRN